MFHVPEKHRLKNGPMGSDSTYGNNGAFLIKGPQGVLRCIASDGLDWEHVSVSRKDRIPHWKEMCFIKDLFWDDEDTGSLIDLSK